MSMTVVVLDALCVYARCAWALWGRILYKSVKVRSDKGDHHDRCNNDTFDSKKNYRSSDTLLLKLSTFEILQELSKSVFTFELFVRQKK